MAGTDGFNADPEKQSITVELPCEMVARVQKMAQENNSSLSGFFN